MKEILVKQISEINEYWIVYFQESGETGHIQLSACANNYAVHRGGDAGDKIIGLRYKKDGFGCYELFTAGHLLIKCPLKPGPADNLKALLRGKKAADMLLEDYQGLEDQLNGFGWKTIEG